MKTFVKSLLIGLCGFASTLTAKEIFDNTIEGTFVVFIKSNTAEDKLGNVVKGKDAFIVFKKPALTAKEKEEMENAIKNGDAFVFEDTSLIDNKTLTKPKIENPFVYESTGGTLLFGAPTTTAILTIEPTRYITLRCGQGQIRIDFETGEVKVPQDIPLDKSALEFWKAVSDAFPEAREMIIKGAKKDKSPLTHD